MFVPYAQNVSLLPGTDVLSNAVGQLPFLAADSENYSFSRSHNTREKRVMRGTGTFLPRMVRTPGKSFLLLMLHDFELQKDFVFGCWTS